jgi:hypothetical protein
LFGNLMRAALLETDQETRIAGLNKEAFDALGQHIDDAIKALRRQLAMGDMDPALDSTRFFLVRRGFQPDLSQEDWRRLTYVMTQASLEAYEGMAARQSGAVVKQPPTTSFPVSTRSRTPPRLWQRRRRLS